MNFITETVGWLSDPTHWSGPEGIPVRLFEHLALAVPALLIAAAVSLPAGLYVGHARRGSALTVGLANIARAVPSFALMGLFLPATQALDPDLGFRVYPALIAMTALAVPPILVNTLTGISEVDAELVEAARGMGFREVQLLRRIEIPLALPIILGGVRSASVQVVATTTLAAILAYGGLGRFIVDGIAQNDEGQLFGGVVLVAVLAVGIEGLFALFQRLTAAGARRETAPGPGGLAEADAT